MERKLKRYTKAHVNKSLCKEIEEMQHVRGYKYAKKNKQKTTLVGVDGKDLYAAVVVPGTEKQRK